jgi:hypothetical protein
VCRSAGHGGSRRARPDDLWALEYSRLVAVAIARRLAQTDPLWFQRVPYERWLDEMVAIAQKRISNQEKELEVSTGTA